MIDPSQIARQTFVQPGLETLQREGLGAGATQAERAVETGTAMGMDVEVLPDLAADLEDSMEELSAMFEEKTMQEVGQRKLGREKSVGSAALIKAINEWISQFGDLPGRDFLNRMLRQLRQPGSRQMTPEEFLKSLARGSKDPSHQFAMLDIFEQTFKATGEEKLAKLVRDAKQLLEREKGAEVRAGINIAKEVNARAQTPEQMQDLRNLYRHETLGFKSPQDCFRSLLASRGPERLDESLDFLVKSCGIDLQNPSPSQSPEELRRIILDLQCVNVLKTMMERCNNLVGRLPNLFNETSLLNGRQLAEHLTNLTEVPFPSPDDFSSLLQTCGFAKMGTKIFFNTQLMDLLRALSPRLFSEDNDRFKLLDAAQENLDTLVKAEEEENKKKGKEQAL